ncbi:MAG: D-alanyl-D-alanine carboxypeptidase family protein [Spirochaetia bacterium]|jgi:D-alanyl-D-alanine carboxypeptidase (penicillin-binding protein 5/6)|nr:D-alanyl-D-alanine carboxypeptidase family protein [Spirochaetia bacterium]
MIQRSTISTHTSSISRLVLVLLLALAGLQGLVADTIAQWPEIPVPPEVDARSVAIVDLARGELLYSLNPDEQIPPASLTKLMTIRLALEAVKNGRIGLDDIVDIRHEEVNLPYGSSLMYLQAGMKVPFDDLIRGMAVISGNDAALAVARVLGGSTEGFARMMNDEASRMGLSSTRFVEPSGLSERNLSTAAEMAAFSRRYLLDDPEAIEEYHARTSMEFPRAEVMPEGVPAPEGKILLRNRNNLLFSYDDCDGLKTGFIRESGYNQVVTAERAGSRFIVVTMGGSTIAGRNNAGTQLLDWAFANWRTVNPALPELPAVRAWGGATQTVDLVPAEKGAFTVPRQYADLVSIRVEAEAETMAPVAAGQKLGNLVYLSGGRVLRRVDLLAVHEVPQGHFFIRLRDALTRFFRDLFTKGD